MGLQRVRQGGSDLACTHGCLWRLIWDVYLEMGGVHGCELVASEVACVCVLTCVHIGGRVVWVWAHGGCGGIGECTGVCGQRGGWPQFPQELPLRWVWAERLRRAGPGGETLGPEVPLASAPPPAGGPEPVHQHRAVAVGPKQAALQPRLV